MTLLGIYHSPVPGFLEVFGQVTIVCKCTSLLRISRLYCLVFRILVEYVCLRKTVTSFSCSPTCFMTARLSFKISEDTFHLLLFYACLRTKIARSLLGIMWLPLRDIWQTFRKWILRGTWSHHVYIVQELNLLCAVKACYVITLLYGFWKICCRKTLQDLRSLSKPLPVVGIVFSFHFISHPHSKCQTVLSTGVCRITCAHF